MSGNAISVALAPSARGRPRMFRRLRGDGMARLGAAIVAIALLLAVFGPYLAPYDPQSTTAAFSEPPPPLLDWPGLLVGTLFRGEPVPFWFGTDNAGLDVFSRTLAAPRSDLVIALCASIISAVLGTTLGLIAGLSRNLLTATIMRASDLLQSFPVFITAMILVSLAGRNAPNIILTLALVYTPVFVRLTRAEVVVQMTRGYVEAARALGNRAWRVALFHVLPNSVVPAMIQLSTTVGFAILLTAGLSFVGAGIRPPTPEWGLMIAQGSAQMITGEWWESVFPGIAVSLTILGFAALGHALEQAYD
jgi:peptide/nickel transport system permease protein